MNNRLAKERLGEIVLNNFGSPMELVEYNGVHDILVKFEKGKAVQTSYGNFKKGKVKSPFDKTIFGIGYLGEGRYKAYIDSKQQTPQYITWRSMLQRCYSEKFKGKHSTYKDCTVCEEWHNFQNFAAWYDENIYECEEKLNLDKDILYKNNKLYSPKTCVFVPYSINLLFIKNDANRGKYPIGVHYDTKWKKYVSKCANGKRVNEHRTYHNNVEDAFISYKEYKEKTIKQVALEKKSILPEKLLNALLNYQVEIED